MRDALKSLDAGIARVERALLLGMLAAILLLVVGQIALRVARHNLPWADELARFLMLWTAILGASLATRSRTHITIDLLTRAFSPRGRAVASILAGLVALALCAFLCAVGVHYVAVEIRSGYASRSLGLPFWVVKSIFPAGLAVIALRFLLGILDDVHALRAGDLKRFAHAPAPEPGRGEGA